MYEAQLQDSRNWVVRTRRLTVQLCQALSKTVYSCQKFRNEDIGYFYDCPQHLHIILSLQNTFRNLEDLQNSLNDLADRCGYFAKEVSFHL